MSDSINEQRCEHGDDGPHWIAGSFPVVPSANYDDGTLCPGPAAPSVSTDPEKVRAQALHEAILAVHNSRFYDGQPDCNYHGVRNAERVLREQLGAQLNYPAHTCESADTGHSDETVTLVLTYPADTIKMLRETFCVAQNAINRGQVAGRQHHADRLQRLMNECDRQRPLGPDGKHGNRHAPSCGEHLKAWEPYGARYSQSAERIAERGGFSYGELVDQLGHEPTTWLPIGAVRTHPARRGARAATSCSATEQSKEGKS